MEDGLEGDGAAEGEAQQARELPSPYATPSASSLVGLW